MATLIDQRSARAAFTPPEPALPVEASMPEPEPSAGGWFTCQVGSAGPAENGNIYILLKDVAGAFPFQWYYAVSNERKEMLATALAAITSGFKVSAYLVSKDAYSQISRLYVQNA